MERCSCFPLMMIHVVHYVMMIFCYVIFLNKFSRYVTNVKNISVYHDTMKNAKSHRKQLYHPPETVMSPAGNSYVTQDTVISPSRVFVLHTN